jgi:surface antigen
MRNPLIAMALALSLVIAGCGPEGPTKSDTGLAVGAIAGGLLGNSVGRGGGRGAATIVGAVVGGIVGSEIGRSMDRQDRLLAQRAEYDAFERGRSGEVVVWRNPDNDRYGEIVPMESYRRGTLDCRDYEHRVYIDGRRQILRGTACRNPDGTWSNMT